MKTPVSIVSGFLGAGKTSAIREQLSARAGERVAVIVNDFGEASLDELELAEGEPFRITNIPGGCVCCTAPEGFVGALGAVLAEQPDRLIIEPTGLARPQDLIDTIRRSPQREKLELGPLVVLVDPRQLAPERLAGQPLMREQAESADVLVANHTDRCSPGELERFDAWAGELWPAPLSVRRTTHGRLDSAALDWPEGQGPRTPRAEGHSHEHAPDSTLGFSARSWRWAPERSFSRERLSDALERLAAGGADAPLARFKGIFRTQEGVYRVEVAGGDLNERLTGFRRDSRADAIFEAEDGAALDRAGEWLEAAVLREDELALDVERIELVRPDGRVHLLDRDFLAGLPEQVDDISNFVPKREGAAARLSALWRELELPDAGSVTVVAGDGFATEPVAVETLCQGFVLHSLAGEALPDKQGGPFRLLIPERANAPLGACANVKAVAKFVLRES